MMGSSMVSRVLQGLSALSSVQRWVLGGSILLVAVGVGLFLMVPRTPDYAPLVHGLELTDSAEATKILKDQKIDYRLQDNSTSIEVPRDQVHEARLALATKGLPRGGGAGFELIDKGAMFQSEFSERLFYTRGLAGELGRTLLEIEGIEKARVHLSIPEEQAISSLQKPPSASVTLRLKPGVNFGSGQVTTVVNLVTASVAGLDAEHVAVADHRGRVLWDGQKSKKSGGFSGAGLEATEQFQRHLEERLTEMIAAVVGEGKCVVRVAATLDLSQKDIRRERYTPASGAGAVRVKQSYDENYHGAAAVVPAPVVASPAPKGRSSPAAAATPQYGRRNESVEYANDHEAIHETCPAGQVKSLHVAVLLDEEVIKNVDPRRIESLVTQAAGLVTSRGDALSVQALPFRDGEPMQSKPPVRSAHPAVPAMPELTPGAIVGGIAVVSLLVLVLAGTRRRTGRSPRAPEEDAQPDAVLRPDAPEPAQVAALMRTWMTEDGSRN